MIIGTALAGPLLARSAAIKVGIPLLQKLAGCVRATASTEQTEMFWPISVHRSVSTIRAANERSLWYLHLLSLHRSRLAIAFDVYD
jgi:hypothetical protein